MLEPTPKVELQIERYCNNLKNVLTNLVSDIQQNSDSSVHNLQFNPLYLDVFAIHFDFDMTSKNIQIDQAGNKVK